MFQGHTRTERERELGLSAETDESMKALPIEANYAFYSLSSGTSTSTDSTHSVGTFVLKEKCQDAVKYALLMSLEEIKMIFMSQHNQIYKTTPGETFFCHIPCNFERYSFAFLTPGDRI